MAEQNHRFLAEKSAISENTATCFPATASYSNTFERRALCTYQTTVTLKIEKLAGEHGTTLKLIGRIRAEHLAELRGQIAASAPSVLDLREVTLVDAEVVRFLSACESEDTFISNIAQPTYASGLSGNRKAPSKGKSSAGAASRELSVACFFEFWSAA
jgi:hypothetical protein